MFFLVNDPHEILPIIAHAIRLPECPVVILSSNDPKPRSSSSSCTITERPYRSATRTDFKKYRLENVGPEIFPIREDDAQAVICGIAFGSGKRRIKGGPGLGVVNRGQPPFNAVGNLGPAGLTIGLLPGDISPEHPTGNGAKGLRNPLRPNGERLGSDWLCHPHRSGPPLLQGCILQTRLIWRKRRTAALT